jgi:hypothetical protein
MKVSGYQKKERSEGVKQLSRKVVSLLLGSVLVLTMFSAAAFAAWPSFQNDSTNNGSIPISGPSPPLAQPYVTTVNLSADRAQMAGVDAESVIANGVVYTVYNGGATTSAGGARVQATNINNGALIWSTELFIWGPPDAPANNVSQLSTPYLDEENDTLYAAKSYTTDLLGSVSFANWTPSGAVTISGGVATFTGSGRIDGTVTLSDWTNLADVVSNIAGSSGNYEITISNETIGTVVLSSGTVPSQYGSFAQYKGNEIEAGEYTLSIVVNENTSNVTVSSINMNSYYWALYTLTDLATGSPMSLTRIANGHGQANTPISYDSSYVYWGIWGGDRSYYQYHKLNGTLKTFSANDDFYGAGAYSDPSTGMVFMGCDSAKIYVLPANNFTAPVATLDLTRLEPNAGSVRSSIAFDSGNLYFTSQGLGAYGYLWRIENLGGNFFALELPGASTSTPVISSHDNIYVGYYAPGIFPGQGGVVTVPTTFIGTETLTPVYTGDPVQASPIVFPAGSNDYIYFTTNSASGAGYCYRFFGTAALPVWTAGGSGSNNYALQGFASDGGKLVYGDDSNTLYIMS